MEYAGCAKRMKGKKMGRGTTVDDSEVGGLQAFAVVEGKKLERGRGAAV